MNGLSSEEDSPLEMTSEHESSQGSLDDQSSFSQTSEKLPMKRKRSGSDNITFSSFNSEENSDSSAPSKEASFADFSGEETPFKKQRLREESEDSSDDHGANAASAGFSKAEQMMRKMGYMGKGLGKHEQGRIEPVEASKQKGRRGLGHHIPQLEKALDKWDPNDEVVQVKEDIDWLINKHQRTIDESELNCWMGLGKSKATIDDEVDFCRADLVKRVCESKSIFDTLDKNEMRRARTRSNPYETIKGAFFLNRAAVKMANMDRACDFMFTKANESEDPKSKDLLYFADVCAGPGGFSEYVLWRKKWRCKGFGFTLKCENDFKLEDFYAGPSELFHPYYGPSDDGDVYKPENQDAFTNLIMQQTNGEGVHFMMADGGFSVEGQENIQEILSKQLYLCQCLVALKIVRVGGHFVTKLFDIFTPFSAGLVYLMYRCFDEISIFKPNTSRPANSERYLICKGKRGDTYDIKEYLDRANRQLNWGDKNQDVMQLVPMDEMQSDNDFINYLVTSNEILAERQVVGLLKIAHYSENSSEIEIRQEDMRKQCLCYWELPDDNRTVYKTFHNPQQRLQTISKRSSLNFLTFPPVVLSKTTKDSILQCPLDWYVVPCASGKTDDEWMKPTYFLGLGRTKVYQYLKGHWQPLQDNRQVELPLDTLIYGELAKEFKGQSKHQSHFLSLHIIDAYLLCGEDISEKFLPERQQLISAFCEALAPIAGCNKNRVVPKDLIRVSEKIETDLKLKEKFMKSNRPALVYEPMNKHFYPEENYFVPGSLMFLKCTTEGWSCMFSKSTQHIYFFDKRTGKSEYENRLPQSVMARFMQVMEKRSVWFWNEVPDLPKNVFLSELNRRAREVKKLM